MRLFKLSESEKKYTWRQWLYVAWQAICAPILFYEYVMERRWIDRESAKTMEQRHEEMKQIVAALKSERK